MNEYVNGNKKLFRKEVSNVIGGKGESCSRIKDRNERQKCEGFGKYFEDLYNIDTQEQVVVQMCGFDGIQGGNYFRGEPIGRAEIEV